MGANHSTGLVPLLGPMQPCRSLRGGSSLSRNDGPEHQQGEGWHCNSADQGRLERGAPQRRTGFGAHKPACDAIVSLEWRTDDACLLLSPVWSAEMSQNLGARFLTFGGNVLATIAAALVGRKVAARMQLPPEEDAWVQVAADLRAAIDDRPLNRLIRQ